MKIEVTSARGRTASFCISLLLAAPGFYVGILGLTDMAPSSPRGLSALAELLGFGFCTWAVFSSIRVQTERFLSDVFSRTANLIAAAVLAYGFYLSLTIIGLEASWEHKKGFSLLLQILGFVALLPLISQMGRKLLYATKNQSA